MKRIEFRLSMPGNNAWNGRWSGEGRNYTKIRKLSDKRAAAMLGEKSEDSWGYAFGDGWFASVSARIVPKGERLKKSDGFYGYEWMVDSIVWHGEILTQDQQRERMRASPPSETPDGKET